jgi:predicted Ser/Thr protein kinase
MLPDMEGKPSITMDPERWQRMCEILNQALRLPAEQRAAYLDDACRGDAPARAEVESLIAAANGSGLLDRPVASPSQATTTMELSALAAGRRIGPYQIVEMLGRGGMGVVYKAIDTRLDRLVALKLLSHAEGSELDRVRFLREAKAASALNHPNIVTVYEYNTIDGLDFIAMEFISGATLRDLIVQGKPLAQGYPPPERLLDYARQAAGALARAHAAGIIHRDLKPGNIMITDEGVAKVLDFGLAKRQMTSDSEQTLALTRAGTIVGTPAYMSPEQAMGQPLDHRADIFSFGIILYEIACGRRPFQGQNPQATLHQIATVDPPAITEVNRAAPAALARLIERCLKKNRDERPASMAEVVEELSALVQPRSAPAAASRRAILASCGLVVAGLAAGVWYSQKPTPSQERGLICSLEGQPLSEGQPVGEPRMVSAADTFQGSWRFRLRAQAAQAGYLYLVDEGPDQAGGEQLAMLYPIAAGTPMPPNQMAATPWYRIEGTAGSEHLWIVWSRQPVSELEGAIHGGRSSLVEDPDLASRIRGLLAGLGSERRPSGPEPNGTIQLRGSNAVLGAVVELRHQ